MTITQRPGTRDAPIANQDARAHKLAHILWHLLKFKQPFNPALFAKEEAKMKRKKLQRLQTIAATLNYSLVPNQ